MNLYVNCDLLQNETTYKSRVNGKTTGKPLNFVVLIYKLRCEDGVMSVCFLKKLKKSGGRESQAEGNSLHSFIIKLDVVPGPHQNLFVNERFGVDRHYIPKRLIQIVWIYTKQPCIDIHFLTLFDMLVDQFFEFVDQLLFWLFSVIPDLILHCSSQ